jgi:hypothetical protein
LTPLVGRLVWSELLAFFSSANCAENIVQLFWRLSNVLVLQGIQLLSNPPASNSVWSKDDALCFHASAIRTQFCSHILTS